MDGVGIVHKRRQVPPHCDLPCERAPDPKRHMGRIAINRRVFCWFCCLSYQCCQIWEPVPLILEEWQVPLQAAALEIFSQILKGQRPWRDLEEVVRLLPSGERRKA